METRSPRSGSDILVERGHSCPMPLGIDPPHPGGMAEKPNVSTLGVPVERGTSPAGTAEALRVPSAVPAGLVVSWTLVPNVETLGSCHMSLRDIALALFCEARSYPCQRRFGRQPPVRGPVPPHPSPLPKGEGATLAAPRTCGRARYARVGLGISLSFGERAG